MEELIFSGYGIKIFKINEKIFLRYDAGEIVIKMKEIEITEKEAIKAQISSKDAYEVILEHENRS